MQQSSANNEISKLPPEILALIFDKLTPEELLTAARVCKLWNNVSSDNVVWKTKVDDFANTKNLLPTHSFFYKEFFKENNPILQIRREIAERIALNQTNNYPEYFSSPLTCLKKLEDLVKEKTSFELPNHKYIQELTILGHGPNLHCHPTVLELATSLGLPKTVSFLLKKGHVFPFSNRLDLNYPFDGLLQSYVDFQNNIVVNKNYFEVIKMICEKFYVGNYNYNNPNMSIEMYIYNYFESKLTFSNAFRNEWLILNYSQFVRELCDDFREFLFKPELQDENTLSIGARSLSS